MTPLPLRPHHILCLSAFAGRGYAPGFVANMAELAARVRGPCGGETEVVVVGVADAICAPCPLRRGTGCSSQARIDVLDAAHAEVLGLRTGDRLTWRAAQALVAAHMSPRRFAQACAGCSWQPLGLCAAALSKLRREV